MNRHQTNSTQTTRTVLSLILLTLTMLGSSLQAQDGMSLYLQMEENGSTTFSQRLVIEDNGSMDQDPSTDSIVFDEMWGLYQVKGRFEQDLSNIFNMTFTDCMITRIAQGTPGNERLLITLLSGQYGPSGDAIVFVKNAHVEGEGHGNGHMEIASSYQVWGPSNNGQFSNVGYTTKPQGQNPWPFNAYLGVEVFNGPLTYTAAYINVLIAEVGDSIDLPNSVEITADSADDTESDRGIVPGPIVECNGSCYQAVEARNGIDWFTAKEGAEQYGGHLVTITSEEENECVFKLIDSPEFWFNFNEFSWGPWIGAYQEEVSGEPDVDWKWVTGEVWDYTAWAEGQPDDIFGIADCGLFCSPTNDTRSPQWGDWLCFELVQGFVVELDCTYNENLRGDLTGDGVVDVDDFNQWHAYTDDISQGIASGQRWGDPQMQWRGDVDGNGVIDEGDYTRLYEISNGVDVKPIDGFNTNLPPLTVADQDGTFPVRDGATIVDSMLGGEFDVVITLDNASLPFDGATVEIEDSHFCFRQDATSTSHVICSWDGPDQSPFEVRASDGLGGGEDLSGCNAFALNIRRNDIAHNSAILAFSSPDDSSELNLNIPVITEPTVVTYPFDQFSKNGDGADWSKVTTLVLFIAPGGVTGPMHFEIDDFWATSPVPSEPNTPEPNLPDTNAPPSQQEFEELVDQIHDMPSSAIWSVNFPGDNPFDAIAADDFTVPAGHTWTIQAVEWAAEWSPLPPLNPTANVTIYSDAGGLPGDPLFTEKNLPISPADNSNLIWVTMLSEPWIVGEGPHWFSTQGNVNIGTEMRIKESSDPNGRPYAWKNPGGAFGAFGTPCSDWTPGIQCLGQQPSLAIRIWGTKKSVTE